MKFSIKNFFSKCDQIRNFQRIWTHLLKKSLMKKSIFCAVHLQENIQLIVGGYVTPLYKGSDYQCWLF